MDSVKWLLLFSGQGSGQYLLASRRISLDLTRHQFRPIEAWWDVRLHWPQPIYLSIVRDLLIAFTNDVLAYFSRAPGSLFTFMFLLQTRSKLRAIQPLGFSCCLTHCWQKIAANEALDSFPETSPLLTEVWLRPLWFWTLYLSNKLSQFRVVLYLYSSDIEMLLYQVKHYIK